MMYSPNARICEHHGGPAIRDDGKQKQMNKEDNSLLDAGRVILESFLKIVGDTNESTVQSDVVIAASKATVKNRVQTRYVLEKGRDTEQ